MVFFLVWLVCCLMFSVVFFGLQWCFFGVVGVLFDVFCCFFWFAMVFFLVWLVCCLMFSVVFLVCNGVFLVWLVCCLMFSVVFLVCNGVFWCGWCGVLLCCLGFSVFFLVCNFFGGVGGW